MGLFLTDPDGNVIYTNARCQVITGLSAEASLEQGWMGHISSDDRGGVNAEWIDTIREPREFESEYRIDRSAADSESVRWVHMRTAPLWSAEGRLLGHVGTIEDTTNRRVAEGAERARILIEGIDAPYRGLFQGAGDPILVANEEQRLVDANSAAASLVGFSREELLALDVAGIIARPTSWTREEYANLIREGDWRGELELRHRDGSAIPVDLRARRVVLPGATLYLAVARDISARRRNEEVQEERRRLARELHDSVSQVFYGIGLGVAAARDALQSDVRQAGEAIDYIRSLAEVGMAEMRALLFELRPESLAEEGLVGALGKQAAALRGRHGQAVETFLGEEPAAPLEVKEALYRVGQEAMVNALRHSRASRVVVRLENDEERISLQISDDGVGFDPAVERPGHFGLRSMRERVERLGGRVEIDSAPGRGTRVRAEVPLVAFAGQTQQSPWTGEWLQSSHRSSFAAARDEVAATGLGTPSPEEARKHVVVINHQPAFLAFSRVALQEQGYTVTTTNPLPQTFDMIVALAPDVVIVGLGGGEPAIWVLLDRLGRDSQMAALPLIVTGTNLDLLRQARSLTGAAGTRAVVLQPVLVADLVDTVDALIGPARPSPRCCRPSCGRRRLSF
jgi:PAS domain S-box-containing protein